MNAGFDGTRWMKESDDAGEGGARISGANEGAAGWKFLGDE